MNIHQFSNIISMTIEEKFIIYNTKLIKKEKEKLGLLQFTLTHKYPKAEEMIFSVFAMF
jgi:hypothetical protein